jgi:hypothetical protein
MSIAVRLGLMMKLILLFSILPLGRRESGVGDAGHRGLPEDGHRRADLFPLGRRSTAGSGCRSSGDFGSLRRRTGSLAPDG